MSLVKLATDKFEWGLYRLYDFFVSGSDYFSISLPICLPLFISLTEAGFLGTSTKYNFIKH